MPQARSSAAAASQLTLDPLLNQSTKWEIAYRKWRDTNPTAFDLFKRFAVEALGRRRRFGVKLLAERVRWESVMTWNKDDAGFKVNNSFTSLLARDLIAEIPELAWFIETRKLKRERNGSGVGAKDDNQSNRV